MTRISLLALVAALVYVIALYALPYPGLLRVVAAGLLGAGLGWHLSRWWSSPSVALAPRPFPPRGRLSERPREAPEGGKKAFGTDNA